jgi:hypothetical protein
MVREDAQRLKQFCDRRAGQLLRGVFVYGDDGVETVYLREDVRSVYSEEGVTALAGAAHRVHEISARVGEAGTALGGIDGHVHAFENALVLQIPQEGGDGIVVSFDPEVGGQLAGFIEECIEQIES